MSISTNSLFHYTSSIDNLFNILNKGFYPSYCKENILAKEFSSSFAVPIVSFCDIPLSQVKEHTEKYGTYAIGLTLDWARRNRLNPVQYLDVNSNLGEGIAKILGFIYLDWSSLIQDDKIFDEFYQGPYQGALSILKSIKNYSGILERKNGKKINTKFYDEREWRYGPVIKVDDADYYIDIFFEGKFELMQERFTAKPHFKKYCLTFDCFDIKYILIDNAKEIPRVIKYLKSQTHLFKNEEEYQLMLTRILTIEQIREDF